MSEHREPPRPHYNGWPRLDRDLPTLPELPRDATMRELALAYATIAATFHNEWPKIVMALEWLKSRIESDTPTDPPPPPRGKLASVEDLEKAVDELEEIITGQHDIPLLPALDSDRIRAIAAEEIERKETERLAEKARADEAEEKLARIERAKRPWQLVGWLVTAVLSLAVAVLSWALTRR